MVSELGKELGAYRTQTHWWRVQFSNKSQSTSRISMHSHLTSTLKPAGAHSGCSMYRKHKCGTDYSSLCSRSSHKGGPLTHCSLASTALTCEWNTHHFSLPLAQRQVLREHLGAPKLPGKVNHRALTGVGFLQTAQWAEKRADWRLSALRPELKFPSQIRHGP